VRVGLIVDGDSEFRCLPEILSRLEGCNELVKTLRAKVDPLAADAVIARSVRNELAILASKRVDIAVLLLDYEEGADCPGARAQRIENAIRANCGGLVGQLFVVIKNTKFENWLVADVTAFAKLRARFTITDGVKREIQRGADSVDGLQILKRAANGEAYGKVRDSLRIAHTQQPLRIAHASRSFRRLLRVIGCPQYAAQSKRPVP
jgi:hypothetical protein